ncbi:hypothetical protein JMJ35_010591 [Cladonia borealis]|uniref:Uncharacterized protein n=1 Tax=Cladonia borealis TaxID=184061 RepID=A0AA39U3C0_9LECA|nr:hypothetical protein JMJ35_010591 [Cladonia borealis]
MWHVRVPQPVNDCLTAIAPLIVGHHVLDTLFLSVQGGTVCITGAFGCGRTEFSNSNFVIYISICGERGNETAKVLIDFPKL